MGSNRIESPHRSEYLRRLPGLVVARVECAVDVSDVEPGLCAAEDRRVRPPIQFVRQGRSARTARPFEDAASYPSVSGNSVLVRDDRPLVRDIGDLAASHARVAVHRLWEAEHRDPLRFERSDQITRLQRRSALIVTRAVVLAR